MPRSFELPQGSSQQARRSADPFPSQRLQPGLARGGGGRPCAAGEPLRLVRLSAPCFMVYKPRRFSFSRCGNLAGLLYQEKGEKCGAKGVAPGVMALRIRGADRAAPEGVVCRSRRLYFVFLFSKVGQQATLNLAIPSSSHLLLTPLGNAPAWLAIPALRPESGWAAQASGRR